MKLAYLCSLSVATALVASSAKPLPGGEVTLKGIVLNNVHTGECQKSVFIYALDGTPEIRAEVDQIMADFYPEKGLDGDSARKVQDQFTAKLKYYITGPLADQLQTKATYARQHTALTGTITEKDGKRWINASKTADAVVRYPAKMLAADKPLVVLDRPPLVLKLNDTPLSLKCIWVPAGKFFMGEPYYQCPHWQEAPPHMVTLTKGFYMSECPVTYAMFEDVVGTPIAKKTSPATPFNASCAEMYDFCRALSKRTKRTIRVPTAAEWEYAARVGTSNPAFRAKYKEQDSSGTQPMSVMSKRPNAWGFYDMFSSGWERVSDGSGVLDRQDKIDPRHIPPEDQAAADQRRKHGHFGKGNSEFAVSEIEYITSDRGPVNTYPGVIRFRVVVEGP